MFSIIDWTCGNRMLRVKFSFVKGKFGVPEGGQPLQKGNGGFFQIIRQGKSLLPDCRQHFGHKAVGRQVALKRVHRHSFNDIKGGLAGEKLAGTVLQLRAIMDDVAFVNSSTPIDELLPEMSRKRTHISIVVDNDGNNLGILTVEDILEELVGEIYDEDDPIPEGGAYA